MAMTPCKECGKEISTEAKVCPHCGARTRTGKINDAVALFLIALIVLGLVLFLLRD